MNHVDQPTALRMKGWEGETHSGWVHDADGWHLVCNPDKYFSPLPAPNVCEIGEELTYEDLGKYFCVVVDPELRESPITTLGNFCKWLYSIMHDANALAKVWLWVNSNKKGE